MIHYHHIDGGMSKAGKARFLQGRHGLVSFVYQNCLGIALEMCQTFVLDNGAFTVWKQGGELDIPGFTRWAEDLHKHPAMDWALIPDSIDGDEADNDALLRDWPGHLPGVPVWHMHEDIARLERLCGDYRIVALGSSGAWPNPGTDSWWARMGEAMDTICDAQGRPPCKLHGLRMLDPNIFIKLPLASADSINAVRRSNQVERFGYYVPATAEERSIVVANRIESHSSAAVWVSPGQLNIFKLAA